jgi:arabinogalactan oligomer/maltooligosaccharide transport system substrate-binding protein
MGLIIIVKYENLFFEFGTIEPIIVKTKSSRFVAFSFLWILAIISLAACRDGASPGSPVAVTLVGSEANFPTPTPLPSPTSVVVTGTVTIWHSWEEPYVPALLRRIFEFNKLYPNIYFDVQYVPALDLRSAFEQFAQEGHGPSLLIGQAEWGPELYDKGLVADLAGLVPAELLNTLNRAAVGTGRYREALISVPVDIRGVVLYRNQSIIPIAPSTFDEMVSLAKEATRGQRFGAVLDRSFFFSGAHLIGLGGRLMDSEGKPAFNNLKGLEWMILLQAFSEAGPAEFFTDNDLNLFKEGRAGMIIDGTWNRIALAEALGAGNLVIDPWPIHAEGSLSGFVQAESVYLSPDALAEEHAVSLKFLQYFLSPESQAFVAQVGLIPAINGSPVNLAASQVKVDDPLIAQAMLALVDGITFPVVPEMSAYTSQMDIALKSVFEGGVAPEEALKRAEEAILTALATPEP